MKDSLHDITVKDILKREPWQANDQCLKSLFSKVPETARAAAHKSRGDMMINGEDKLLTGKEIEEMTRRQQD
jgi:hypothetical protein